MLPNDPLYDLLHPLFGSSEFPEVKVNRGAVKYSEELMNDSVWNMQPMVDPYETAKKNEGKRWKTKSRKNRFPKDGGRPIKASVPGYDKIPFHKGTVTMVGLNPGGEVQYSKSLEEMREMAFAGFKTLLICWPGAYSQDIFIVDDLTALRTALGFKRKSDVLLVDEHGEEWTR